LRLTLFAIVALSVAQPDGPLDLQSYAGEIDRLSAGFAAAPDATRGAALAAAATDRLIVDTGPRVLSVDLTWIDEEASDALERRLPWEMARARILRRLASMREDALEPRPEIEGEPAAEAKEVLSRQEFKQSAASQWLEGVRERVGQWLRELLERVFGSRIGNRSLATAFAWITAIVALAALATFLARLLVRHTPAAALEIGTTPMPRMAARHWAQRALAAARAGDLREAIRLAYHAAVNRLDEQGFWKLDESRTPREYVRLLPDGDPRRSPVADLTRRFEQIWYGHRAPTAEDGTSMAEQLERLGCLRPDDRAI
jgi:hypothetical protein